MAQKRKTYHYHQGLVESLNTSDIQKATGIYDHNQDEFTYEQTNLFLSILTKSDNIKLIKEYRQKIEEHQTKKSFKLNVSTYALLINLYCLTDEIDIALAILEKVKTKGYYISIDKVPTKCFHISLRLIRPIIEIITNNYHSPEYVYQFYRDYKNLLNEYEQFLFLKYFIVIILDEKEKQSKIVNDLGFEKLDQYDGQMKSQLSKEAIEEIFEKFQEDESIISSLTFRLIQRLYSDYDSNTFYAKDLVDGYCKHCGNRLQLQKLSDTERNVMVSDFLQYHNKNQLLKKFPVELNKMFKNRSGENPLYIIDAGNVGYYNQKDLSYYQVQMMLDHLKKRYSMADFLIIMHIGHIEIKQEKGKKQNKFEVAEDPEKTARRKSKLDRSQSYITRWEKDRVLYKTRRGVNDDLFWILGGLYLPNTYVITNDLMHDHHENVFKNKGSFFRWRSKHVVNYHFERNFKKPPTLTITSPLTLTPCFQKIVSDSDSHIGFHIPYYPVDQTINLSDLKEVKIDQNIFVDPYRKAGELVFDWTTLAWSCLKTLS